MAADATAELANAAGVLRVAADAAELANADGAGTPQTVTAMASAAAAQMQRPVILPF